MIRRIFIMERPTSGLDVSKAEVIAPLTTVFGPHHRRELGLWDPRFRMEEIPHELERLKFNPEHDAVLVAGSSVLYVMAIAYIVAKHGYCETVMWDATNRDYTLTRVGDVYAARG